MRMRDSTPLFAPPTACPLTPTTRLPARTQSRLRRQRKSRRENHPAWFAVANGRTRRVRDRRLHSVLKRYVGMSESTLMTIEQAKRASFGELAKNIRVNIEAASQPGGGVLDNRLLWTPGHSRTEDRRSQT